MKNLGSSIAGEGSSGGVGLRKLTETQHSQSRPLPPGDNDSMKTIQIEPIGNVISEIRNQRDERWGEIVAEIRLDETRFEPVALNGLHEFSHVEILFQFDQLPESEEETKARHPRENPIWPKVGIFAQRGRKRPNRIGATICEIVSVEGLSLHVHGLDAFNGSPVLDIKPVMAEFLPESKNVRQPRWAKELMSTYF